MTEQEAFNIYENMKKIGNTCEEAVNAVHKLEGAGMIVKEEDKQ